MRRWLRTALLVVLVLCAGCAVTVAGSPSPADPIRPRSVPIDDVSPCELLTAEQRATLGLDRPPVPFDSQDALFGRSQACSIRGNVPRAIAIGIFLAPETGIERFTEPDIASEIVPITIAGFPAVLSRPDRDDNCVAAVDVAPGQVVGVQLATGGRLPPIPQDVLCTDVSRYAEQVMLSVLDR